MGALVPSSPVDTRADTVPPCFLSSGHHAWNCREPPAWGISQLHSAARATKAKTSWHSELLSVISTPCSLPVQFQIFDPFSLSPSLSPCFFHLTFTLYLHIKVFCSFPFSRAFLSVFPVSFNSTHLSISPSGVCLVHFICELLMEEAVWKVLTLVPTMIGSPFCLVFTQCTVLNMSHDSQILQQHYLCETALPLHCCFPTTVTSHLYTTASFIYQCSVISVWFMLQVSQVSKWNKMSFLPFWEYPF